jgi:hypothetical protein
MVRFNNGNEFQSRIHANVQELWFERQTKILCPAQLVDPSLDLKI